MYFPIKDKLGEVFLLNDIGLIRAMPRTNNRNLDEGQENTGRPYPM